MLVLGLVFIVSLSVLVISSKLFTSASERIGLGLSMSPFSVGVLIVALGTSLPELFSSILSVSNNASEIVPGNVIGANISNIFLLLGVVSIFSIKKEITLGAEYIFIDLHFLLGSTILFTVLFWDGDINFKEGIVLVIVYVVYVIYLLQSKKSPDVAEFVLSDQEDTSPVKKVKIRTKDILILPACAAGIYFGADYTVKSVIGIAETIGVSPAIISLTALSLGTTLPELAVSITAARKGNSAIAVGNILGSCIFNSLAVTGVASFFGKIIMPPDIKSFPLPLFVIAAAFFYTLTHDNKISRYEGLLFLIFYAVFLGKVIHAF